MIFIKQRACDGNCHRFWGGVADFAGNRGDGAALIHMGRGEENAIIAGMNSVLHHQRNFPGDAGAGKPAGIRNVPVIHADSNQGVGIEAELIGDVIGKRDITVGPVTQIIAVAPYPAVLIDAVKNQGNPFSFPLFFGADADTVPADSAGQIAGAAGIFPGKGPAAGAVMGKAKIFRLVLINSLLH